MGPLGCPLLEGSKDFLPTSGGPPPLTPTMVIVSITTLCHGIIPSQPHLGVTNNFPP